MQVAPNQISPGEPFDIFYFVRNPLDNTSYFVRAKIHDVRTGELLDTITLQQSPTNARLFIKTVQAPADPSGYGRNIVAIASVYLDSGFTQQSETYEEQEQYYLIKAVSPVLGGGGSVDYRIIREMLEEAVSKKLGELPKAEPQQAVPYENLFDAITALQREVDRIPKELPDGAPLMERISAIQTAIEKLPSPEKLDLTPVLAQLSALPELVANLDALPDMVGKHSSSLTDAATKELRKTGADILHMLEKVLLPQIEKHMQEFIGGQELSIPIASLLRPNKRNQNEPADVRHLMNQ